jgi:hypothetical protein
LIPPDRPFFARTRKTLEGITYLWSKPKWFSRCWIEMTS